MTVCALALCYSSGMLPSLYTEPQNDPVNFNPTQMLKDAPVDHQQSKSAENNKEILYFILLVVVFPVLCMV